jgi:hypothetical protein
LLEKKCGLREVCDPEILDCATGLCVPYEPACDGNRATKCDEYGLGYTGASTDCGPLTCSNGSCVDCGEIELKDALRLDEIASGLIAMRNVSGCAVSLEDVALDVSWASTRHVWKLPALELSPGEAIAFTPTGEQGLAGLEDATDAPDHKTIMICTGASALSGSGEAGGTGIDQSVCDADTVLDAVLFGLDAPELPSGLGWVGSLTPNIAAGDSVIRKRYSAVPTYFYDGHWEILP